MINIIHIISISIFPKKEKGERFALPCWLISLSLTHSHCYCWLIGYSPKFEFILISGQLSS